MDYLDFTVRRGAKAGEITRVWRGKSGTAS